MDNTSSSNDGAAVWTSVSIQQIQSVDTSSQTFSADVWINCLYFDPKVMANPGNYKKGAYIDPGKALEFLDYDHFPVYHLTNDKEASEVDSYIQIYDEPTVGSVLVSRRVVGTFAILCDVHNFPFDNQRLEIKFFMNDCYNVMASKDMPSDLFGDVSNNEWFIEPGVDEVIARSKGASGFHYTTHCVAARQPPANRADLRVPSAHQSTLVAWIPRPPNGHR